MKTFKSSIDEVAEPLSKGEKNFKAIHVVINNKKLVPGVTDQDHVFNGIDRKMDQPTASYEIYKDEDESKENYDKGLKVKEEPYAEEVEVDEATLSAKAARAGKDIGKPGKNFAKIAADAAKRYGSKEAGQKVAGAILSKMRKEDIDYDYEGEMAKAELCAICDKADKLANMMSDEMQLEAWLQSKISKAKDHIDAVYDYMMYSDKQQSVASVSILAPVNQSSSMADTYGSFLNRMGEEVEQTDEALGTMSNIKKASMKGYNDSRKGQPSLSPKQKKIAAVAGNPNKIDAEDLSKLRSMKKEEIEIKSIAFNNAMNALNTLKGI